MMSAYSAYFESFEPPSPYWTNGDQVLEGEIIKASYLYNPVHHLIITDNEYENKSNNQLFLSCDFIVFP